MNQIVSLFIKKDKKQSFEALLAPHLDLLLKIAYQYTGNKGDAEDLLQDLLVDLYADTNKLKKVEKIKPWLTRCLYHKFIDNYRRNKNHSFNDNIDDPQVVDFLSYTPNHEEVVLHQRVVEGLQKLSAAQRSVVTLHDMNGFTLVELSKIMQKPVGTLKSDLHRARKALKSYFKLQPSDFTLRQSH